MKNLILLPLLLITAISSNLGAEELEPEIFEIKLSGIVCRPDGEPASGADVYLSYLAYHTASGDRTYGKPTVSGDDGRFSFSIPAVIDEVYVSASLPGTGLCGAVQFERFDGILEDSPPEQKITLQKGRTVTGTVRDAGGKPVSGVFVGATALPHFTNEPSVSGENGDFKFHTLSERIVSIYAYKPGSGIAIYNPGELPSKDNPVEKLPPELGPLDLTLLPLGKIPVFIDNPDAKPVEGIRLKIEHLTNNDSSSLNFGLIASSRTAIERKFFTAVTDKKGEAVIDWIPKDFQSGRLIMEDTDRFREDDGMEIAYPVKETTLIGKEESLDLRIPYGYYIRGKVVTEDGRPYKRSLVLRQKHFFIANSTRAPQSSRVSPGILTDSAGRFAFVWDRTEFNILQLFTGTVTGEIPEFVAPSIKLPEPKRGRALAPIEIRLEKGAIVRINHPVDSEKAKLRGRISLFEIIEEGEAEIPAFLEIPAEKEGFYEIRLPKGKYDASFVSGTLLQPPLSKSFEITGEKEVEIDLK